MKAGGAGALALGASACGRVAEKVPGTGLKHYEDEGQMEYRVIPNTGDKVSLLGYGGMRWPMVKDENGKDIIDQAKVNELVDYAIAHGVNYFDSAPVYLQGQGETAMATALLRHPRDKYFIATKLSNLRGGSLEDSIRMYRRSLEIYQTDHIDYYLLHSTNGYDNFHGRFESIGMMDFLLEERKKGHIRNLGWSFHGNKEGFDEIIALHEKYHWDFVMIQLNYVDWNHPGKWDTAASYLYEELTKRNIPVMVMEPLLGGQLTRLPDVIARQFKEREPEMSLASWSFRFIGSLPGITCVLSGMTYMENLVDNVNTFSHFKPLTEEECEFLENEAERIKEFPLVNCTACNYCMPCPYGIDIPGIFKHYNSCINEGLMVESEEQSDFKKLRRKYLTSYNKAVETIRQADHCISCRQCIPTCPQHIKIPGELIKIDNYIEKLKQGKF